LPSRGSPSSPISAGQSPFVSHLAAALGCAQAGSPPHSGIYLAAVSGGADSVAMIAGLAELRHLLRTEQRTEQGEGAGFALYCVHVDHGIRPPEESRADARAVKSLCAKLEIPCRIVSIPPGKIAEFARRGGTGIEAAARFFRRRAFAQEARRVGAGRVLTAHTRDDVLETLLMRVLRGSGPAGLAAMPASKGLMLRPLLGATRQDVLAYLEEKGIPYRTDSTNADIRFLRNRIRHKLVPLLDEFFPSWRSSLLALAETQSLAADFIASEAFRRLPWKREAGKAGGGSSLTLSEADFFAAPRIVREEAIFAGADMLMALSADKAEASCMDGYAPVPKRSAVRRAAENSKAAAGDLGAVRLRRRGGFIELAPAVRFQGGRGFSLLIREAGSYALKGEVLGAGKTVVSVRAGLNSSDAPAPAGVFSAAFPLVLRSHRTGDRLRRGGHDRRFSDILGGSARSGYVSIITAEDTEGIAAFICIKEDGELLVICREAAGAEISSLFEVFGGVNA